MSTFTRWVGTPIPTPGKDDRGSSPVGRQRHYGAVELGDPGEQVNVNDVVEVGEGAKFEVDQPAGDSASGRHPPRLAQVGSQQWCVELDFCDVWRPNIELERDERTSYHNKFLSNTACCL